MRGEPTVAIDDETLARLLAASDPVLPEIAERAKAAFIRRRLGPVLPVILELRAGEGRADPSRNGPERHSDLLLFGGHGSTVEQNAGDIQIDVEAWAEARTVTMHAAVRHGPCEPSNVTVQSPAADHPMSASVHGGYDASGLPSGPLRVSMEFPRGAARSVVTTWFVL